MEEDQTIKRKHGFILENENFYVTRDNKVIDVEKFKLQCQKAGIEDWRGELKKL